MVYLVEGRSLHKVSTRHTCRHIRISYQAFISNELIKHEDKGVMIVGQGKSLCAIPVLLVEQDLLLARTGDVF